MDNVDLNPAVESIQFKEQDNVNEKEDHDAFKQKSNIIYI